jgi:hypothetical protein
VRAVEQIPDYAGPRSSRHDEMCALVARRKDLIFPRFSGEVIVTIEAPCGRGFVDVLAVTDAPPAEVEAALVEVKTRQERTTGGDILRQLRWYERDLPARLKVNPVRRIVVVEDVEGLPVGMLDLLIEAGVEVVPVGHFEGRTGVGS